jgi:hypothetical protein
MKKPKTNIQIATIGAIMNTVVMNVVLDHIDMDDSRGPIIWYKEPRGRKVKGQIMNDTLIALVGWDNFDKWTECKEGSSGFKVVQETWDGTLQLRTKEGQKAIDLWERIYRENLNPNFRRYDILKINDQVLYTVKESLEDDDKRTVLRNIFKILKEMNTDLDTESKKSISVVGKSGATWYLTEWDEANHSFFGYASLFHNHNDEWGYIPESDLLEMNAVVIPHSQKQMRNHKYYKNN